MIKYSYMQEAMESNFEVRRQMENMVRFAVVDALINKPKIIIDIILGNEEIKVSVKEMTNINFRYCVLAILALAEFVPLLELSNDATKSKKFLNQ